LHQASPAKHEHHFLRGAGQAKVSSNDSRLGGIALADNKIL